LRVKEGERIRVLLSSVGTLFREGVVEIFTAEDDMLVVGEAENGVQGVALAGAEKPDVVLLDVEMPGCNDSVVASSSIHLAYHVNSGTRQL